MKVSKLLSLSLFVWTSQFSLRGETATPAMIDNHYFEVLRSGDARKLRSMLDIGASPNARDAGGNPPLMHAAVYGNLPCMRLLLQRGANVNATNMAGATPLMRASFDYEKTRELVNRGALVNTQSKLGNTPLMLAARPYDSHRTVELLLEHGADAKA